MQTAMRDTIERSPARVRSSAAISFRRARTPINVGAAERAASLAIGVGLVALGAMRRGWIGGVAGGGGTLLVLRGATGRCIVYRRMERSTAAPPRSTTIERSITIGASPDEIANGLTPDRIRSLLPFLQRLSAEADEVVAAARLPGGRSLEWRARFESSPSSLRWTSLSDDPFGHDLRLDFAAAPGGRGSDVMARLEIRPPAGSAGAAVAQWLRGLGVRAMGAALARLKQSIETGEIATTSKQPMGPRSRSLLLLERVRGREFAR
jgi:uncharacterized membrane protein